MTRRDDDLNQLVEDELNVLLPDGGMLPRAGSGLAEDGARLAVWRDARHAPAERVEDLLRRMTLAEKAGQLRSTWLGSTPGGFNPDGGGTGGNGIAPLHEELAGEAADWGEFILSLIHI